MWDTDAFVFCLDDPSPGSAPSSTGRIPEALSGDNRVFTDDHNKWTTEFEILEQSVQDLGTFELGTSFGNAHECCASLEFGMLAGDPLIKESQAFFPSPGISQSIEEALAEDTCSRQTLFPANALGKDSLDVFPYRGREVSGCSPSSTQSVPSLSATPLSDNLASANTTSGKVVIAPEKRHYACPHCKKTFSSENLSIKHMKVCAVHKPFRCICGTSFKLRKDRSRHQKSGSCTPFKQLGQEMKRFSCTCGQRNTSYTRYDSLLRHIQRANSKEETNRHQLAV